MRRWKVHQVLWMLLLAAAVGCGQVLDRTLSLSNERSSIERTYELTKYLDHQLKEIRDTYLSYLGPPFSDPGFSPPRPNSSSLSVPSAATRVDLWRGLENGARLAQNQRAYSVLLCAVKELARSTLCPYLQNSLLHFCSGLSGLLGSISGLMNALGYTSPPYGNSPASSGYATPAQAYAPPLSQFQGVSENSPAPLRSYEPRNRGVQAAREGVSRANVKRDRERERGRRGRRKEGVSWAAKEEGGKEEGMERWGKRRRLLSFEEEKATKLNYNKNIHNNINYTTLKLGHGEMSRKEPLLFSLPSLHPRRSIRSIQSSHSGLSPLSLLYQYGGPATEVHTLLASPVLSSHPVPNDFSRKVEGFWILRELQSWLWRSAKDFTRLKKRLRV